LSTAVLKYRNSIPPGVTKPKYLSLLRRLYGDDFPRYLREFLSDAAAPQPPIPDHVEGIFDLFQPQIAHFGVRFQFSTVLPLTRPIVALVTKQPRDYVIVPEPAGTRCLFAVVEGHVRVITESHEVTGLDVRFPFEFALLEGYVDHGRPIVSDIRVFEREDVSHLPFVSRAALLKGLAPTVTVRPFYRVREAKRLIMNQFLGFATKGIALAEVNSELSPRVPGCFLWRFDEVRPIVSLFVTFAKRGVIGQVIAPTALLAIVTLDELGDGSLSLNGEAAEVRIVASPRKQASGLMIGQFVGMAAKADVWTHDRFVKTFPDFRPSLTRDELLDAAAGWALL
jgi:hypothetical protein